VGSSPDTVQSQSSTGKEKSTDLGGKRGELVYQGSINGKANPSRRSSASPETEEGGADTDSPGTGGEATGASTIASVDATGTARGASNPSPVLGCGEGPTGALEEEEAIDHSEEQRKKKKKNFLQRTRRRGRLGERAFSFSENSFFPSLGNTSWLIMRPQ
jgi:hypothetical protein